MATLLPLPTNPVGLYWENYHVLDRLINYPTAYNMLHLFQAEPVGGAPGTTGAVFFTMPSGSAGTNLVADIATCQARGQRVILTIGGANAQVAINTQARADAFIQSIKDINVQLGGSGTTAAFNGIDWNNYETVINDAQITWMRYVGQQLKAYYGTNFLITSPPAVFGTNTGGQAWNDRQLLAALHEGNALDWICPQFYDGPGNNTTSTILARLDFYNTQVNVNGNPVQIPRSKIGIGFGILPTNANWWTAANAATSFTAAVNAGKAPRGGFNFAASYGYSSSFASTVAPVMTNYTASESNAPFSWKGYTWKKRNGGTGGPGMAGWSSSNITDPDSNGYVTLSLTNPTGSAPIGCEMYTEGGTFGYGTYTIVVDARMDTMHKAVVFGGLFTYDTNLPPAYNEIDVHETSAWGATNGAVRIGHNVWYDSGGVGVVRSEDVAIPADSVQTHRLIWTASSLKFDSFIGTGVNGTLIKSTTYTTNVPTPANEQAFINLWVFGGGSVSGAGATPITITIRDFSFTPPSNPTPTLPAFQLTASSNISASGQNTTAQLTAPTGKTTGDFTTGRMQDDENPADSINIGNNGYTELEWCIQATSDALIDGVYEFRVTAGGTALDTYTTVPQVTIAAATSNTTRSPGGGAAIGGVAMY